MPFAGWGEMDFMFGTNRMFTLPGLNDFFFAGQWVTSMGRCLPMPCPAKR